MKRKFRTRTGVFLCLILLITAAVLSSASAADPSTLRLGSKGESVRQLQQSLITLGYLNGKADGVFGKMTQSAVIAFQKKNGLKADGLAGKKTLALIQSQTNGNPTPSPAPDPTPVPKPDPDPTPAPTPVPDGSLFGGNYATLRIGDRGDRVKILQNALIKTGDLSGKADGSFGKKTRSAVWTFQKNHSLKADGVAGKKTLTTLEKAVKQSSNPTPAPTPAPTPSPNPTPTPAPSDLNDPITPPSVSSLQLLHWFDDVKPALKNGQQLLIYSPSSGLSWTLRVLSRGRHCDAEPLTAKDTRTMIAAFGGVNTWNQMAVYVRLPDGRWTVGSTHDMPHDSGTIKNNDFDGHLCVHFLRNMEEAEKNDPNYGVSNQKTIREFWKRLTGQEITE